MRRKRPGEWNVNDYLPRKQPALYPGVLSELNRSLMAQALRNRNVENELKRKWTKLCAFDCLRFLCVLKVNFKAKSVFSIDSTETWNEKY